ncbi:MAG: GIY-YIG nuclease family protein [Cyclobacteriaceae bacterium]
MRGRKLVVYMIDGKAYGPRTAEIGNWSGKAIFSPRANISKIIDREEFIKPGVYCLRGNPENDVYQEKVYIGEAEKIGDRLRQHMGSKEFTEYIGFISKDEFLTKSHIKYLESRLITMAKEAKSAELENGNAPALPTLPEPDIADMEFYLEQIKLILPLMGFNFLIPSVVTASTKKEEATTANQEEKIYHIKSPGLTARIKETDDGFVVMKGSEARGSHTKSYAKHSIKRRQKMVDEGTLTVSGNKLVFTQDAIFTSISAAADLVLGRSANGNLEWVDQQGRTYKENQA